MPDYRIVLATSAARELNYLSGKTLKRVLSSMERLASNPRPPRCKKLQGGDNEWRIRVGDYRVIYMIDDTKQRIEVTRIRHRSEVYER